MALYGTYYFNGPDLASATSVYTNEALTVLAADGFYSDGITHREQTAGVLGPNLTCPSCQLDCTFEGANAAANPVPTGQNYAGTWNTEVSLGEATGS